MNNYKNKYLNLKNNLEGGANLRKLKLERYNSQAEEGEIINCRAMHLRSYIDNKCFNIINIGSEYIFEEGIPYKSSYLTTEQNIFNSFALGIVLKLRIFNNKLV
jgi:hypothetical protein